MSRTCVHISYLKNAFSWAQDQSYAERLKVGAFLVKDGQVLSQGHNGTISKFDNNCEVGDVTYNNHVIHAEANALDKMAKSTSSSKGGIMYCTDTPCVECSKRIINCDIDELYFVRDYHNTASIDLLLTSKVKVHRVNMKTQDIKLLGLYDTTYFREENNTKEFGMDRAFIELIRQHVYRSEGNILRIEGMYFRVKLHGVWRETTDSFIVTNGEVFFMTKQNQYLTKLDTCTEFRFDHIC